MKQQTETLWTWRTLELSQIAPHRFILAHNGSSRRLVTGEEAIEFRSRRMANAYLEEQYPRAGRATKY